MSLTDVMSAMSLDLWPRLALIIFAVAFVGAALDALLRSRREVAHLSRLTLEDDDGLSAARPLQEKGSDR